MMKLPLKDRKYKPNQTILSVYGYGDLRKIKVTTLACLRTAGVEDDSKRVAVRGVNDCKMEQSIIRARSKIFELAYCNPWEWFFTATLDPAKYDRTDLKRFHKDLTQWFRDLKKKEGYCIKFLLIPELHADGRSWHMHGFLSGLPSDCLCRFVLGDRMGRALAEKVKRGDPVFNWPAYSAKFGFCDLEPIRSHEAVCKYVTKYISKSLASSVKELNAHLYYHSRGLSGAEIRKKGTMLADIVPSFQNDYCSIAWFDYDEELLERLESSIVF